MAENLVIVESPAKAKTIEKYLGVNYKVASSFGHISDFASKNMGIVLKMILNLNMRFHLTRKLL